MSSMKELVDELLASGWTVSSLARASGIALRTWQRWHAGKGTNSSVVRKRAMAMKQLDPAKWVEPRPAK